LLKLAEKRIEPHLRFLVNAGKEAHMKKLILSSAAAIAALSLVSFGPAQAQAYRTAPGYYTDPVTGAVTAGADVVGGAANFGTDIFGGVVGGVLSPFGAAFGGNDYRAGAPVRVQRAGYNGANCHRGRALVDGVWRPAFICP
jgi:hypothetical protein